jgi:hypothetical protein
MPPIRPALAALLTGAAFAAAPAAASAAPPPNDNYLASTTIASSPFSDVQDTTEATTQPDLFNPSAQGQPLGGAGPEGTTCNGQPIGKTIWYDLTPPSAGGVEIQTSAAFDQAVAVYEWNPANSLINRLVQCQNTPGTSEDVILEVKKGKAYTFQVGGVGGAGGQVSFKLDYFPDTDGDTVLDAQDKCKKVPGIEREGGCPPSLRGKVTPSLNFANTGNGIRITRLVVDGVPKGAKVVARAAGGGSQTVKAKRNGRVALSKLVGRTVSSGGNVEIRVTLGRTGTGTYKYGANGAYFKWPVKVGGLGARVNRCIAAGTSKIQTNCS